MNNKMEPNRNQQENKFLAFSSPRLSAKCFTESFGGTDALSELFKYEIRIACVDDVDLDSLLNQPASVALNHEAGDAPQYFHGIITAVTDFPSFKQGSKTVALTLMPALARLQYRQDCRIFLDRRVTDLIKQLLGEHGITDVDFSGLKQAYPIIDYCTQYNESDYAFLSRIAAGYGICFYFTHQADKHVLHFTDHLGGFVTHCVSDKSIDTFSQHKELGRASITLRDYNPSAPASPLQVEHGQSQDNQFTYYQFPGDFTDKVEGERHALYMSQYEANRRLQYDAESQIANLASGCRLQVAERQSEYLISRVSHYANDYSNRMDLDDELAFFHDVPYHNELSAQSVEEMFRPKKRAKPRVHCQTAVVVGPKSNEVNTDALGRIKVRFHWQRDDNVAGQHSAWLRVSSPWAGHGRGFLFLPRVGDEVLVDFLYNDIDRPIVIGSLYNQQNLPPYTLPAHSTQTGIKSQSIPKQADGACNELRFENKAGNEEVLIQAQKNFFTEVQHDYETTVAKDHRIMVQNGNHRLEALKGMSVMVAEKAIVLQVGESQIKIEPEQIEISSQHIALNPASL
jgi:type VI secretion system secreted protein VgrG